MPRRSDTLNYGLKERHKTKQPLQNCLQEQKLEKQDYVRGFEGRCNEQKSFLQLYFADRIYRRIQHAVNANTPLRFLPSRPGTPKFNEQLVIFKI